METDTPKTYTSRFPCGGIDANTGEALTGEALTKQISDKQDSTAEQDSTKEKPIKPISVIIITDNTRERIFNCPGLHGYCCGNLRNRTGKDGNTTLSHPCPFLQKDDKQEGRLGRVIREIKELASGFKSCLTANSRPQTNLEAKTDLKA